MSNEEIIKVLEQERACVARQGEDSCDRDCARCDLVMDDKIILQAYDAAVALLRTHPPAGDNADKNSDTSARLAAIKDIPTERLIELAVAEAAGLISISPSAAERAHQDAQPNEPLRWRSCKKEKPTEKGRYEVVCRNGDIPPYVLLGFWNPDNPGWDLYGVTHWRPLPEPPKEEV